MAQAKQGIIRPTSLDLGISSKLRAAEQGYPPVMFLGEVLAITANGNETTFVKMLMNDTASMKYILSPKTKSIGIGITVSRKRNSNLLKYYWTMDFGKCSTQVVMPICVRPKIPVIFDPPRGKSAQQAQQSHQAQLVQQAQQAQLAQQAQQAKQAQLAQQAQQAQLVQQAKQAQLAQQAQQAQQAQLVQQAKQAQLAQQAQQAQQAQLAQQAP